jgi:hypothetical protein
MPRIPRSGLKGDALAAMRRGTRADERLQNGAVPFSSNAVSTSRRSIALASE